MFWFLIQDIGGIMRRPSNGNVILPCFYYYSNLYLYMNMNEPLIYSLKYHFLFNLVAKVYKYSKWSLQYIKFVNLVLTI
jgi:hypothetical protein